MFVTNVLDDWLRRLAGLGMADRHHGGCDVSYGNTYDDFLQRQKDIWTPSDIYEKCCPRFLAGGLSRRSKSGQFVCCGGCQKLHPVITLYFDSAKGCTVATLSYLLDPFTKYFNQCVKEGSGVWKSPLYCELNGFLRENLHRLRHHQRFFGGHLVKTAIGALEASDVAQRARLEEAHLRQHLRRHSYPRIESERTLNAESIKDETGPVSYQDTDKLGLVLEICRLWGLEENLDVLSIHCMLRTSQVFRKIGILMAKKRVRECKFVITPLVDGHVKSGHSVFRRANPNRERVIEREGNRLVEYAVGSPILYLPERDRKGDIVSENSIRGHFLPVTNTRTDQASERNKNKSEMEKLIGFSWACEELSYTNLELEFMDTSVPEYVGQKVVVHWRRSNIDIPDKLGDKDPDEEESHSSLSLSLSLPLLPVFRLKLDWATQKKGIKEFSSPHFDLKLDIERSSALQVDEVTFMYRGKARVLECRADFAFLVAAYARSLEPCLIAQQKQIETMRPLLRHEIAFLREVKLVASFCSSDNCTAK